EAHGRRRRRRRRRGRRGDTEMREGQPLGEPREERAFAEAREFTAEEIATGEAMDPIIDQGGLEPSTGPQEEDAAGRENDGDNQRKRRRRGRRGGRRRRRGGGEGLRESVGAEGAEPGPDHEGEQTSESALTQEAEARSWSSDGGQTGRHAEADTPHREPEAPPARSEQSRASEHHSTAGERPAEAAQGGAVNVPPPVTVTERPANPKRGWWHRLTQS